MIRAKMSCESVVNYESTVSGEKYSETVRLRAVYSPNPESENYSWSKYTPCGEVSLTISNPNAWGKFEVSKEYFVDFTLVEAPSETL